MLDGRQLCTALARRPEFALLFAPTWNRGVEIAGRLIGLGSLDECLSESLSGRASVLISHLDVREPCGADADDVPTFEAGFMIGFAHVEIVLPVAQHAIGRNCELARTQVRALGSPNRTLRWVFPPSTDDEYLRAMEPVLGPGMCIARCCACMSSPCS